MQIGDAGDEPAVHLLRPRRIDVAGAQAGFDMRHRDLVIKGGERAGEGRRRVALHDDPLGAPAVEHPGDPRQHRPGQVGEILVRSHDVEVPIRLQLEQFEKLRQHLAMLSGDADLAFELGPRRQFADHRRELDRFGSGAEDEQDPHPPLSPSRGSGRSHR